MQLPCLAFAPLPSCSYRPHCRHCRRCRSPLIFLTECSAACNANASGRAHHRIHISLAADHDIHSIHILFVCLRRSILRRRRRSRCRPDNLISFVDRTDCTAPLCRSPILSCFIRFCRIVLPSFDCVSSCAGLLLPRRRTLSECVIRRQKMLDSRTYFSTSGFPFGPFPISLPSSFVLRTTIRQPPSIILSFCKKENDPFCSFLRSTTKMVQFGRFLSPFPLRPSVAVSISSLRERFLLPGPQRREMMTMTPIPMVA